MMNDIPPTTSVLVRLLTPPLLKKHDHLHHSQAYRLEGRAAYGVYVQELHLCLCRNDII